MERCDLELFETGDREVLLSKLSIRRNLWKNLFF